MKRFALSFILMMTLGTLCLRAQTIIQAHVDQYPPLQVLVEEVAIVLPAGGITLGSDIAVAGGDGTYTYLWTDAAGTTVSNGPTATITQPGDYYLRVTDGHDCQVIVRFTTTVTDGITAATDDIRQLRLFDTAGRLVKTIHNDSNYAEGMPSGAYVLSARHADGRETVRKIIIK